MSTVPDLLDVATRLANLENAHVAETHRTDNLDLRLAAIETKLFPPAKRDGEDSGVVQPGLF